jgi:Icc-related predicted phosphoesterase
MVKLLVLSDLHVEFTQFVPDEAAAAAADIVVLAGDIHKGDLGITWARYYFPEKPIVYVHAPALQVKTRGPHRCARGQRAR